MIEKLLKLLKIKFSGEIPLKDGTMIRVDGDVAVGASVYVQSPDGEMPLPDGDYELETGEILSAEGGKITAITSPIDTEEVPDIEEPVIVVEEVAAPVENELPMEPETEIVINPEVEKLKGIIDELIKRLDEIESKVNMKSEVETQLRSELDFIKTKTLEIELKKSKVIEDATITRFDVIKNLKNNK